MRYTLPVNSTDREDVLLLGADHCDYDAVYLARTARTVGAISVGNEQSQSFKEPREIPNEDALLAIDDGPRTLLAVADAHFGPESSHEILDRLFEGLASVPRSPAELLDAVQSTRDPSRSRRYSSETTLMVAVLDREAQGGFGLSYGDSSLVLCHTTKGIRRPHAKNEHYVTPCRPSTFDPKGAVKFVFPVDPGTLVMAFTDGIDECHYRHPGTSIQGGHIQSLWKQSEPNLEAMTRGLVELALSGVGGYPGGQDNVALAATVL